MEMEARGLNVISEFSLNLEYPTRFLDDMSSKRASKVGPAED